MERLGCPNFEYIPFDIDLPKPDSKDIGTYTVKTTDGHTDLDAFLLEREGLTDLIVERTFSAQDFNKELKMKVLFVVTARGGSKGVPKKNIKVVGSLPLIAYKIISAQKCNVDKRVIVSTDDEEIAAISIKYGAEVPFMRPAHLATDSASSMDVIEHAMQWVKKNDKEKYEYVCMLEPSSPFASYIDLDNAFELLDKSNADTLLGMKEVDVNRVFIHSLDPYGKLSYFYHAIKDLRSLRRQDQKKEYTMNGCMYIAKWDYFEEHKLFHSENSIPYIMPNENSIEIDSIYDYEMACYIVEKSMIDLDFWKLY